MSNNNDKNECVGTLLVHQSDVKELAEVPPPTHAHDECVGSLIVHQSDVQELGDVPASQTLTRRVTEKVAQVIQNTEHVNPDDDILNWQYDV